MKPVTRKTILSSAILTAAFTEVLFLSPVLGGAESPPRLLVSGAVMGAAIVLTALVWATGSAGPGDHHKR